MPLPCRQHCSVFKMKSLLLVLFFGASVTLAKSPFEHKALDEFSGKERDDLLRESADEENDPKLILPTIFPAEVSPIFLLCVLSIAVSEENFTIGKSNYKPPH